MKPSMLKRQSLHTEWKVLKSVMATNIANGFMPSLIKLEAICTTTHHHVVPYTTYIYSSFKSSCVVHYCALGASVAYKLNMCVYAPLIRDWYISRFRSSNAGLVMQNV